MRELFDHCWPQAIILCARSLEKERYKKKAIERHIAEILLDVQMGEMPCAILCLDHRAEAQNLSNIMCQGCTIRQGSRG